MISLKNYRINPDKKYVSAIVEGLIKKDGHCPCRVNVDDTTLCPCDEFVNDGICLIRQGIEVHQNPDTNLEIADAIGRVYVTFIDKDTLKPSQKEAIMKEYIRYSGMLMRDISDIYLRNKNEIR